MKTLLILSMMMISNQVLAFEKEDTFSSLQQAIMDSNKDINEKTKVMLDQENDRIGSWGVRDQELIEISNDIAVEARNYELSDLEADQKIEQDQQSPQANLQLSMND